VRSDGTVVPSAPVSSPAPAPVAAAVPRPVAQPVPVQPAVAQPATPRPVAPAPVQPQRTASVSGPGFVVQVSAARSEAEAQAALRSAQGRYASILSGQPTSVRKVELGDRGTFYRAHIGPYATREQANDVCASLKSAGGDCVVQQRN
jgi:cell division septation protein DedD